MFTLGQAMDWTQRRLEILSACEAEAIGRMKFPLLGPDIAPRLRIALFDVIWDIQYC